jgi:hypothetical protein
MMLLLAAHRWPEDCAPAVVDRLTLFDLGECIRRELNYRASAYRAASAIADRSIACRLDKQRHIGSQYEAQIKAERRPETKFRQPIVQPDPPPYDEIPEHAR